MNKNKNLGFTLAEVLIVIGIIGVVAALTLPNLNHATGDKETVTRVKKIYSVLNEANDRAVAIYGPVSTWMQSSGCKKFENGDGLQDCWPVRISEFLKTSNQVRGSYIVLSDGVTISLNGSDWTCEEVRGDINDICTSEIEVDINGNKKGPNDYNQDIFTFMVSDSIGVMPYSDGDLEDNLSECINNRDGYRYQTSCTFWVLEYGNLDYLKADNTGKCNDSNIILDGVTNTSCH